MPIKAVFDGLLGADTRRGVPLAFYPGRKLLGLSMDTLLRHSDAQAQCLHAIQETFNPPLLVRMTEQWVEADAFGARVDIKEDAFPAIVTKAVPDIEAIGQVRAPGLDAGRLPVFIEGIEKARARMPDAPLFAGVTGPFSLAGCLSDAQELMMACYTDPDAVHAFLGEITRFITAYCQAYHQAGASGVFLAEPSVCMLSPKMAAEFSHDYVGRIVAAVQRDDFAVVYHNCGEVTPQLADIKALGAMAYHFGDAVPMAQVLDGMGDAVPVMGNIHPAKFMGGDAEVRQAMGELRTAFGARRNFILSCGCDLSPDADMAAIAALCQPI